MDPNNSPSLLKAGPLKISLRSCCTRSLFSLSTVWLAFPLSDKETCHSPSLTEHHCQSPCQSLTPGRQLGRAGNAPLRGPGFGSWQQTLARGFVSLHSTADELQREKLEGNGIGLCLQTSNTNSRWGLVLVKGHLQLQLSVSAVLFNVSHYPPCPTSLTHAPEMDCAGTHRLQ